MFFRKIFGKKPKAIEPPVEKLSIDSLEKRVEELKVKKLEEVQSRLKGILNRICEERESLFKELKTLSQAEPTEEVYLGVHKAVMEARRLLAEKLTRVLGEVQRHVGPSIQEFQTLDGKLVKMVNLTTGALITHGRHVRTLFASRLKSVELRVRKIHGAAAEVHTLIESQIKEMHPLESITSKISSHRELRTKLETLRGTARSLERKTAELEGSIGSESDRVVKLVKSEEFKDLSASERELERIEREIARVKGEALSAISTLSRPLRKMRKLVARGELQSDRETVEALELCIDSPSEILSSQANLSTSEKLLGKMVELLEEGKIEMETGERRKRVEFARRLLEGRVLFKLREDLERLEADLEAKKRVRERTLILDRKVELERSIEKRRSDLKHARAAFEELCRESRLLEEGIGENLRELEKLASEAIGTRVELIS